VVHIGLDLGVYDGAMGKFLTFLVVAFVVVGLAAFTWGVVSGQVAFHGPPAQHVAPQDQAPDFQYP
jgi:hypothetical protein